MKRYLLASTILFTLLPFQAGAAEINAAGADQLKGMLSRILADQKEVNKAMSHVDLVYTGDILVEPKDTYYAVTLPKIEVKLADDFGQPPTPPGTTPAPAPTAPDFLVDLGVTSINAIPDEKPGNWKMAVAIPATISVKAMNNTAVNINIGEQNMAGLFNEKYGYFTKVDANYKNITVNLAENGQNSSFKLGEISVLSNFEEDAEARLTGPANVKVGNLEITDPANGVDVKLGALTVDATLTRYKAMTSGEYKEKMLALASVIQNLQNVDPASPPPANDAQKMLDSIMAFYDMDGFNVRYGINNLAVNNAKPATPTDFKNLNIASAFFGMGLENVKSETGNVNMKFGYSGVTADPIDPSYKGVIPEDVNLDITAQKIPMQSIWTLSNNTVQGIAANPEIASMAGFGLLMKLPAMLSQAGTQIIVKDNYAKSSLYNTTLNGTVTADMNAVNTVTAKFNGVFEGLDELLAVVQTNAQNTALPNSQEFADMLPNLEMLKTYGKAGTGPSGKPGYTYDLEVTPQGAMLLNGQDLSALTGSPAPGATAPQDPNAPGSAGQEPASGGTTGEPLPY